MELKFEVNTQEIVDKVLEKVKDDFIPKSVIEDIKAEIQAIEMEGRVDERTRFIRGGEEVRNLVLKIIDKHISGAKMVEPQERSE